MFPLSRLQVSHPAISPEASQWADGSEDALNLLKQDGITGLPSFHPWNLDDRKLIAEAERALTPATA
jgi:hypothetical protein